MYLPDRALDAVLGLDVERVGKEVQKTLPDDPGRPGPYGGELVWQKKHFERALMTRYHDFIMLFDRLNLQPGRIFADMGSGFGRAGFILDVLYPGVEFVGYEIVGPRVDAANRVKTGLQFSDNIQFIQQNLGAPGFTPIAADFFYVYFSFNEKTGEKVLADLEAIAEKKHFKLILKKGMRGFDDKKTPWLQKEETFGNITIFSTKNSQD